jgi:hypothetical protein
MNDRLEEFIGKNRESFDFRDPDPRNWDKIQAGMKKRRRLDLKFILKRAAAVLLIFFASYMVNELVHRYREKPPKNLSSRSSQKVVNIPELKEAEAYYSGLINKKMEELKPIMASCPGLEKELNYDMSELDSVYLELRRI